MKNLKIYSALVLIALTLILSCKQKNQINTIPEEQENMYDALRMDTALHHLQTYHDSVVFAHSHNPSHQAHYDSLFHHHDSVYHHHHTTYHHGDTTHHHQFMPSTSETQIHRHAKNVVTNKIINSFEQLISFCQAHQGHCHTLRRLRSLQPKQSNTHTS
jgi:hypothetical protein